MKIEETQGTQLSIGGSNAKEAYRRKYCHFKKMECLRVMFFSPVLKILRRAKTVEISPRKRQVQKISSAAGATINYVPSESTIRTQRIVCLKKYIENYYSPWKLIFSHHLKRYGDKFLLHCNYDVADLPNPRVSMGQQLLRLTVNILAFFTANG